MTPIGVPTRPAERPRIGLALFGLALIAAAVPAGGPGRATGQGVRAQASAADTAALIRARRARFQQMSEAMRRVNRALKAQPPSAASVREPAALLSRYARQIPSWYPRGSGPEAGRRTRARPEIWNDAATFRQRARAFAAAAARFNAAAGRGDVAALRAQIAPLGTACRNCHDRFRGPELDDE